MYETLIAFMRHEIANWTLIRVYRLFPGDYEITGPDVKPKHYADLNGYFMDL